MIATVNAFLKSLLEQGFVQALLAPQEVPSKKTAFPVLISDPEKLDANVFAPALPVSTASALSNITRIKGSDTPVAAVMRACQLRATFELAKLKQVNLENILLIGVDCLGTFPTNTYAAFPEKASPTEFLLAETGLEKYLRSSCRVCKDPVPEHADITIGVFGMDRSKELFIHAATEAGEKTVKNLQDCADAASREKGVKQVREEKNKARAAFLSEKADIRGIDKLTEFFDACINCHNCMRACPICYCKECLFDSAVFDLEANRYVSKAKTKGAFKLPADSLLFHVTRMNHMILSCVQCGLCEQACPNNIPLMDLFTITADNAQAQFGYLPGRDPKEPVPMVVFREDEYHEVGEK
jgi:formate dehydrogenase subunit beta